MRQRKADLHRRVNGDLTLEFSEPGLSSYSGLELIRRFLARIDFSSRARRHLGDCDLVGDYSAVAILRLLLAMLIVGARRLRHCRQVVGDPVVARFAGLSVFPNERTIGRWLAGCNARARRCLQDLNAELVALSVRKKAFPRLTIDVDGTVLSTGLTVERAFRGFNPHHRKVPSYYPITACLAQTGHVLRVQNRSGNVHDGKAAMPFLRDVFRQVGEIDPGATIEIRLDGAFFRREIVNWLEGRAEYAIRAPFYVWLGLKELVKNQRRWERVADGIDGFDTKLWCKAWKCSIRVAIYRKKVFHRTAKNFQLDLFDPDDGTWEYSAIATNKTVGIRSLWHFLAGRGVHEKVIGALKTGYAFDAVPTLNYAANSTWQIISTMAHNLIIDFQLATGAASRRRTRKRTTAFHLHTIQTLRYELINKAGVLRHPAGRSVLRLSPNVANSTIVQRIAKALRKAA